MRALSLLFLLFALSSSCLHAQKAYYFQQEVNYTIVATLHDADHTLTGQVDFEYINHSPDVLPEIWV
ncbi:MAG TPA: hypothetical protein PK858_12430, partial [Saprospiraceae bacterium]|nr:hypothetical protein [Saprospiraceae bacterium]